jgi:hypothetical protein
LTANPIHIISFSQSLSLLSQEYPVISVSFVSFGIVALLTLVCTELLIEARNAQGDEEIWWITMAIFLGVYLVLIMSPAF